MSSTPVLNPFISFVLPFPHNTWEIYKFDPVSFMPFALTASNENNLNGNSFQICDILPLVILSLSICQKQINTSYLFLIPVLFYTASDWS